MSVRTCGWCGLRGVGDAHECVGMLRHIERRFPDLQAGARTPQQAKPEAEDREAPSEPEEER